jgi:putative transposase
MGLARSTYYDEPELQPISEARLVEQIKAVCAEWPAYGCRRVTAELHDEGRIVNHKKVMRLMKENGLTVRPRRRSLQRPTAITMGRSSRILPRTLCRQG